MGRLMWAAVGALVWQLLRMRDSFEDRLSELEAEAEERALRDGVTPTVTPGANAPDGGIRPRAI